jgi:hypothetical protein
VRLEQPRDRERVAGRLQRDLIVWTETVRPRSAALAGYWAGAPRSAPSRPRRSRSRRSRDARLGGNNNSCPRSHPRNVCAMPKSSSTARIARRFAQQPPTKPARRGCPPARRPGAPELLPGLDV